MIKELIGCVASQIVISDKIPNPQGTTKEGAIITITIVT
jgi:hypothetical protein